MLKQDRTSKPAGTVAIIPAAGVGSRMGAGRPKQFMYLDGKPLLAVTLLPFQECPQVDEIILVVPSEDVVFCKEEIVEKFSMGKVKKIVPGGKRRQDSVRLGLEAAGDGFGLVLIHDGARPMVDVDLLKKAIIKAQTHRAVITGLPAKETVKEISSLNKVVKTNDRRRVWLIQTPQVFHYEDILLAHQRADREGWEEATDDSLLVERMGVPVTVIQGAEHNIKITTPYDLELATFLLSRSKSGKKS